MDALNFLQSDYLLYEPRLKLRLFYASCREALPNEGELVISYDPEIEADRLQAPRSPEERERYLASPVLAPLADKLLPFASKRSVGLARIMCRWTRHDDAIRVEYLSDAYALRLDQLIFEKRLPDGLPISPVKLMDAGIRGSVHLRLFNGADFNSRAFNWANRIEIWVKQEVAEFLACNGNVEVRARRPSLMTLAAQAFGLAKGDAGGEPPKQEAMELIVTENLVR